MPEAQDVNVASLNANGLVEHIIDHAALKDTATPHWKPSPSASGWGRPSSMNSPPSFVRSGQIGGQDNQRSLGAAGRRGQGERSCRLLEMLLGARMTNGVPRPGRVVFERKSYLLPGR
jgi:hypothetical protein